MRIIANASMFKWIQVGGGKETWDLCGNLWRPSFLDLFLHQLGHSHRGSATESSLLSQYLCSKLCKIPRNEGASLLTRCFPRRLLLLFWGWYLFGTCVIDIEVSMPFAVISRVPVTAVRLLFPCHVMLTKKPTKQGKRENPSNKMPPIKEIIRQYIANNTWRTLTHQDLKGIFKVRNNDRFG